MAETGLRAGAAVSEAQTCRQVQVSLCPPQQRSGGSRCPHPELKHKRSAWGADSARINLLRFLLRIRIYCLGFGCLLCALLAVCSIDTSLPLRLIYLRRREVIHPLVHFQVAAISRCWACLKPGAWNSMEVSCMGHRGQLPLPFQARQAGPDAEHCPRRSVTVAVRELCSATVPDAGPGCFSAVCKGGCASRDQCVSSRPAVPLRRKSGPWPFPFCCLHARPGWPVGRWM